MPKAPRIFVVEDDESIRMLLEVAPVSYTHLDVYKRQSADISRRKMASISHTSITGRKKSFERRCV